MADCGSAASRGPVQRALHDQAPPLALDTGANSDQTRSRPVVARSPRSHAVRAETPPPHPDPLLPLFMFPQAHRALMRAFPRDALAPRAWLGGGEGEQSGAAFVPPPPSGEGDRGRWESSRGDLVWSDNALVRPFFWPISPILGTREDPKSSKTCTDRGPRHRAERRLVVAAGSRRQRVCRGSPRGAASSPSLRAGVSERSLQALTGRLFTHAATPVPAFRKGRVT